jgi:signal transduction histidine kinase
MTRTSLYNILIVDDSVSSLEMIHAILEDETVRIATAKSGEVALKKIKSIPFDLILLDILMPGMDGFEVLQQLKEHPGTRDIPVIILTAKDDEKSIVDGFSYGAIDYVTKPFKEAELKARVRNILDLKTSKEELVKAKEIAEKHSKAKSDFLANMSHEIRTPISGILGVVDLFKKTRLDDEQIELLDIVESSTDLLLTIINDILDLSKIEEGKMKLEAIAFDIRKEVKEVLLLFEKKAKDKEIELNASFDHEIPDAVVGDPVRLKQIFMNLISNAIKFTSEGSVNVNLRVELKEENNLKLYAEVVDTGIGISPEGQSRLFKAFSQVDESTTRLYGGSGLGLTISRNLVHMMHGQIGVKSELGEGSVFYFTLILNTGDVDEIRKSQQAELDIGTIAEKDIDVLMVEDNPVNQKVSAMMLKELKVNLEIAENGREALEEYQMRKPEVIFMDVHMPFMDGYEATELIRNYEKQNKLKPSYIVAITASATSEDKNHCMEVGMDEYITKPFKKEELVDVFKRYLEKYDKSPDQPNG